ncbi:MAG: DUF6778 family protein [Pseudomonadota bacterium]
MKAIASVSLVVLCAGISGCTTWDQPTRAEAAFETPAAVSQLPPVSVQSVSVSVPRTLVVSEANSYLPSGDIVWRGDPLGDRYSQIEAIFSTAAARATDDLTTGKPVIISIEVQRFHALTEKTRYSVGGIHSMRFLMTVSDAETGVVVRPTKSVQADIKGYGGEEALAAERAGQTQKVRITDALTRAINAELTRPEGYKNERLGLIQQLNHRAGSST